MRSAILVVAALAAVGCSRSEAPTAEQAPAATSSAQEATTPPADTQAAAGTAHRVNLIAAQGGQVSGALDLVASEGVVVMTGLVTGMKPESEHGFHVHEKGDCSSPDFASAGEHFNPTAEAHGNPASPPHHLGDVPNIKANAEGKADVNVRAEGLALGGGGANDIVGKAIVVHEKVDDYKTQPSGNSGDRIACGVIE
jgi:Cu-Zn family superoxide dismutase